MLNLDDQENKSWFSHFGASAGRSDGRSDGRTVGCTDGRSHGRSDGRTDVRIGRWDGRTVGRAGGRTVGRMIGRSDGRSHGWSDGPAEQQTSRFYDNCYFMLGKLRQPRQMSPSSGGGPNYTTRVVEQIGIASNYPLNVHAVDTKRERLKFDSDPPKFNSKFDSGMVV